MRSSCRLRRRYPFYLWEGSDGVFLRFSLLFTLIFVADPLLLLYRKALLCCCDFEREFETNLVDSPRIRASMRLLLYLNRFYTHRRGRGTPISSH